MQYLLFHVTEGDTGLYVTPMKSKNNIHFAAAPCHEDVRQHLIIL